MARSADRLPDAAAWRVLGGLWLSELTADDAERLAAVPEIGEVLPEPDGNGLTKLAVEYQRLFGLQLPPYESVFVDPSAMLAAPATARVEALYRSADWSPPPSARFGAADHVGVEMLAMADWRERGLTDPASRLHRAHLALWVPALTLALDKLAPHPIYGSLGSLTRMLVMSTLTPDGGAPPDADPFPDLPPPPEYASSDVTHGDSADPAPPRSETGVTPSTQLDATEWGLRQTLRWLLVPRELGLYLTRQDITAIGRSAEVPVGVSDRQGMAGTLLRTAAQYGALPQVLDGLDAVLRSGEETLTGWAAEYPAWAPIGAGWLTRLAASRRTVAVLREADEPPGRAGET